VENDVAKEKKYIDNLIKRRVDGILLISSLLSEKDVLNIMDQNIPVVHIGEVTWENRLPVVSIDSKEGAYKATRHLLECEKRKSESSTGLLQQWKTAGKSRDMRKR
jgi:Transcriptional regulators